MLARRAFFATVTLAVAGVAAAEVTTAAADRFAIDVVAASKAPPAAVYRALVEDVAKWWSPAHTFSGDATNLSIDGRAGGCFCEALPSGGSVRHLQVVLADPGTSLRMIGGLGPLQAAAVAGTLTVTTAPAGDGSTIRLEYLVSGYSEPSLDHWAAAVDSVLSEQLGRLVRFVDETVGDGVAEGRGASRGGKPPSRPHSRPR